MKKPTLLALALAATVLALGGCASGYDADGATVSTNPNAEGGVDYAPAVIGEITAVESNAITLETSTGSEVVQVTPTTQGKDTFDVGDTVAIDVNRTEAGVAVASVVRRPSAEELEGAGLSETTMDEDVGEGGGR